MRFTSFHLSADRRASLVATSRLSALSSIFVSRFHRCILLQIFRQPNKTCTFARAVARECRVYFRRFVVTVHEFQ